MFEWEVWAGMKGKALTLSLVLSLAVLGSALVAGAAEDHPPSYIYGRWVVKRPVFPTGTIFGDPREYKAMIGTVAVYSASQVRVRFSSPQEKYGYENFVVKHPKYWIRRESADEIFKGYHLDLREIGIRGDSVEIIDVHRADDSDVIAPATRLFIRDQNHLVTIWDFGYLEMVRQK